MTLNLESYPPPFRGHIIQLPSTSLPEPGVVCDCDCDPIPIIDFQWLVNKDDGEKKRSYDKDKLAEACGDWGVFRLVNHGIPQKLMAQLGDYTREIFSVSFEDKKGLFLTTPLSYFWGTPALTPSGDALSRGPQNINWVEGFNVPLSKLSQQHHQQQQQQQQQQPQQPQHPALSSLSLVLEEYGKHLGRIATVVFEAMSEKLNLDMVECKSNLSESTGFLRIYRYPSCFDDNNDQPAWGMDVHTDSSVLSILNQDQVGGLEVLKDDHWFSVKPIPDTLIVNLGDMMQAMSDDKYKSVKHRVKVNKSKERVSICYFVFPGEGSVISSSQYKPFTYRDFQAQVQQDIKSLGHKVGLERFKLNNSPTGTCQ